MKLLTMTVCAALLVSVAANAADKRKPRPFTVDTAATRSSTGGAHRMAGCGLGSMVIEDSSKWAQVGAAFLNGTGVQTFGITTGTSNCTEDGVAMAAREKDAFVEANIADIRRDVALGNGAYLSSLASLYGCKGESALDFGKALFKNREKVLNSANEEATYVIDQVVATEGASCRS